MKRRPPTPPPRGAPGVPLASPYSRMPKPLLALMERPGSARFLVMEGMLTDPLKPARLS